MRLQPLFILQVILQEDVLLRLRGDVCVLNWRRAQARRVMRTLAWLDDGLIDQACAHMAHVSALCHLSRIHVRLRVSQVL